MTFSSDTLDDVGIYKSKITASITQPTDYTLATQEEMTTELEFNIIIGASCDTTQLDNFSFEEVSISLKQEDQSDILVPLPVVMDSTSRV